MINILAGNCIELLKMIYGIINIKQISFFDGTYEVISMIRKAGGTFFVFLFLSVVVTCNSMANSSTVQSLSGYDADLVWAEYDGIRHEIFFTTLQGGKWSPSMQVTDDNYNNLHPVVDRDGENRSWIFWTAIESSGMKIRYIHLAEDEWSEAEDLPTELTYNIAPSFIFDKENIIWVVWAGNDGGQDDIYFTRFRNGKWDAPARVNPVNEVPDILPEISLQQNGLPEISWKSYSGGKYTYVTSDWDNKWSIPAVVPEDEPNDIEPEDSENLLDLPGFFTDTEKSFVRIYK